MAQPILAGSVTTGGYAHYAGVIAWHAPAGYLPAVPRTSHQELGEYGETVVVRLPCPKCKRASTLRRLPVNFRCADIICDFCGYLAQVKTTRRADVGTLPPTLMGAAWGPQHDRMEAGIYFPLFIVIVNLDRSAHAVYYLPADLQQPEMFQQRKPLRATARRAGWVGYMLRLDLPGGHRPVRLV
jgi:type II restriction enzyme